MKERTLGSIHLKTKISLKVKTNGIQIKFYIVISDIYAIMWKCCKWIPWMFLALGVLCRQ